MPCLCLAQKKNKADTVKVVRDYHPTEIRIGTDVLAIGKSFAQDDFKSWELNGDIDLDRYFAALDIGSSSRDILSTKGHYTNSGTYFRLGGELNFLKKNDPKKNPGGNALFIGARYARGIFSETLQVSGSDPVWGNYENGWSNTNASSRWFELVGGLKIRMWKMLWLGYTARYKFGLHTSQSEQMLPHDVPGYGGTEKKSVWGFNYQIFVTIPVKKKK